VARKFGTGSGGRGAVVPTGAVLGDTAVARLRELCDLGCLVSVSRSRDGGSVAITVTSDGEWERAWFRDEAEAILQLDEWLGVIGDSPPAAPAPATQRQRRTRAR
jgi:hypothetical protein